MILDKPTVTSKKLFSSINGDIQSVLRERYSKSGLSYKSRQQNQIPLSSKKNVSIIRPIALKDIRKEA